ncbi:MAG: hypothetical protein V4549_06585 [Bacteroidota bacterium]
MEELYLLTKEQLQERDKKSFENGLDAEAGNEKRRNIHLPEPIKVPTDEELKDEREQAVKRGGEIYAENYMEGLLDGMKFMRDQFLKQVKK